MEINIKKKKKPVWPWIVAILVVLAIIFVLYTQFGDEIEHQIDENLNNETSYVEPRNETQNDVMVHEEGTAYYDEVKDFINFVDGNEVEVENQSSYTEKATIYLANALNRMVVLEHKGDVEIESKRDELMLAIALLSADSTSMQHSQIVGQAFSHAAGLMMAMQKKDYPALQPQIQNVEKMANSIQPHSSDTDQISFMKEFFMLSKAALQAISEIDTL